MRTPKCGVLGVKLVGEDGSLQPSCRYFPTPWNVFLASTGLQRFFPRTRLVDDMSWDHASVRECDWVPGCYYLVRREVIDGCRPIRPALLPLLRGGGSLPRRPQGGVGRGLLSVHPGRSHWRPECGDEPATLHPVSRQISPLQIESELLYFRKHHGLPAFSLSASCNAARCRKGMW